MKLKSFLKRTIYFLPLLFIFIFYMMYIHPVKDLYIDMLDFEDETDADYIDDIPSSTEANNLDSDNDGIFDHEEIELYGTDPHNPDTDGDEMIDGAELDKGYDPTGPGEVKAKLVIKEIELDHDLHFSREKDKKKIEKELKKEGIIHYPETTYPGRKSEIDGFVTAHGSVSQKKYPFSYLYELEKDHKFYFEYELHNGRKVQFHYKIIYRDIVKPDNDILFEKSDTGIITLSTCYFSWRRFIVKGYLEKSIRVDQDVI